MTKYCELPQVYPGSKVRLRPSFLPPDATSSREQFLIKEAPAHDIDGAVVLEGILSHAIVTIGTQEDAISQVVED